jgi:hypothetical protein
MCPGPGRAGILTAVESQLFKIYKGGVLLANDTEAPDEANAHRNLRISRSLYGLTKIRQGH